MGWDVCTCLVGYSCQNTNKGSLDIQFVGRYSGAASRVNASRVRDPSLILTLDAVYVLLAPSPMFTLMLQFAFHTLNKLSTRQQRHHAGIINCNSFHVACWLRNAAYIMAGSKSRYCSATWRCNCARRLLVALQEQLGRCWHGCTYVLRAGFGFNPEALIIEC